MKPTVLLLAFIYMQVIAFGQSPVPKFPEPPQPQFPGTPVNSPTRVTNSDAGMRMYEEDIRKQQQQKRELEQTISEAKQSVRSHSLKAIRYEFPPDDSVKGIAIYKTAFTEIISMIDQGKPSLKRAVFLVENAYHENTLNYQGYLKQLSDITTFCKERLKEKKLSSKDPLAVNMMLHQYFSDTIYYKSKSGKTVHYPYTYDFEDYMGKNDWTKMFVTKLLDKRSGQCHSMPLLYCILSEEMNSGATLAFSPQHTYVKFKDAKGRWCNLELTNGKITSDAWILGSGYIKSEAIRNGVYMQPLTKKQVMAACLFDLAQGYTIKYGFDAFSLQVVNKVLELDSVNIHAWMLKADYYTNLFNYIAYQYGKPKLATLQNDPKAMQVYTVRNNLYSKLDNFGYSEMPAEAYEQWLSSVNNEKSKKEHATRKSELLNTLKKEDQ